MDDNCQIQFVEDSQLDLVHSVELTDYLSNDQATEISISPTVTLLNPIDTESSTETYFSNSQPVSESNLSENQSISLLDSIDSLDVESPSLNSVNYSSLEVSEKNKHQRKIREIESKLKKIDSQLKKFSTQREKTSFIDMLEEMLSSLQEISEKSELLKTRRKKKVSDLLKYHADLCTRIANYDLENASKLVKKKKKKRKTKSKKEKKENEACNVLKIPLNDVKIRIWSEDELFPINSPSYDNIWSNEIWNNPTLLLKAMENIDRW